MLNWNAVIRLSLDAASCPGGMKFSKYLIHCPQLWSFQCICPRLELRMTSHNILFFYGEEFLVHVKSQSWGLTPYQLSAAAYSIRALEYNGDSRYVLFMKADISSSWGIRSGLKIPSSCNNLNTRRYSAQACLGMSSRTVLKTAVQVEISSAV